MDGSASKDGEIRAELYEVASVVLLDLVHPTNNTAKQKATSNAKKRWCLGTF